MNMPVRYEATMMVRRDFNFALEQVPRYWVKNNPFLTRMFDALSLTFPDGERYFIQSVRPFRDKIQDADLKQRVADFIKQEAQHGIAHDRMNDVLREQGMPVDAFIEKMRDRFDNMLKRYSPEFNLAITAASEHLTALMADTFFKHKHTLADVHPYARALLAWHAIEEMEHRDVVFDVMQQAAKVSDTQRYWALILSTTLITSRTLYLCNLMLQKDGFSMPQRVALFAKGLPWFVGRNGTLSAMRQPYMDWFKRQFHPKQHPIIAQYSVWLDSLQQTQDPIQAGEAFWQAALSNNQNLS